ncbi:KDEL receptor A [Dunaliella salina]|uniref:ER lumen protein-retaining receptor n=1 Tax=Dunaliella salina TaxID=3046 RepID=A0ABQ7GTX3_DUNSA|nr:KDEL receptor A [Dunaliella salina]|eukprot:KAF5837994.1 KDEL receptor A [Dunaliella salina]
MNIFRLCGDMTHLASIILLLLKIHGMRSCRGVSLKTQELYALVFFTRYLDLFTNYVSLYNTLMKLVFLIATFSIVYLMRYDKVIRVTYDRESDTFRHVFLVVPCLLLAVIFHNDGLLEILWAFSIFLEAVAILPQLILLQRTQNIDNITGNYVFLLGSYRAFYILNWIYRYFTEPVKIQVLVWVSGLVQTVVYCDFFWYYFKSWQNNEKLALPA